MFLCLSRHPPAVTRSVDVSSFLLPPLITSSYSSFFHDSTVAASIKFVVPDSFFPPPPLLTRSLSLSAGEIDGYKPRSQRKMIGSKQ